MSHFNRAGGFCTIGIDVGGTNTDGVLFDNSQQKVLRMVKLPTNHQNYGEAIGLLLAKLTEAFSTDKIASVNISSTLATNAILEGRLSPAALILIGYEDFPHIVENILKEIKPAALLCCGGGHTARGAERRPLERDKISAFAEAHRSCFFAVSSLYSTRNPEHELAAAKLLKEAGAAGISCGHETAATRLNAVRRTVTSWLNSSLMKVTAELVMGIEKSVAECGISAPVMFIKSDGSLVSKHWCLKYPVETVLSGPAASMRGAALLAGTGAREATVADMGGTSTDIGFIKEGRALFSEEGARIGSYHTMVPSLEIHSEALGGDSRISIDKNGSLCIGPERVVPASRSGEGTVFTPTDALCILGLCPGDREASLQAAELLCELSGGSAEELASQVKNAVTEKLRSLLEEKAFSADRTGAGAPMKAYAGGRTGLAVPKYAEAAGATGAAAASYELSCTVNIMRSFYDNTFRAFLPTVTLQGPALEPLLTESRKELASFLHNQAALIGFTSCRCEMTEETEYLGRLRTSEGITKVILHAEIIVQSA